MTSLPRWNQSDGPSDPGLRAALIDARRGPSEAELSALADRVAQRMRVRDQAVARGARVSWLARAVVGLAGVVVVSSAAWWWSAQRDERPLFTPTRELRAAPQANRTAPSAEPTVPTPPVEQPAPQAANEPSAARVASRAPARQRAHPEHKGSADAGDEVQLLQAARRALLAQPEQALHLSQQHAARFAHGVFVEERQAIAIEALFKLVRRAQAERALTGFLSDYPQSAYRTRLMRLRDQRR